MRHLQIGLIVVCSMTSAFCQSEQGKDNVAEKIVDPIEPQPSYPGGYDSLRNFIKRNLKYPLEDVEGAVYVRLTINTDGWATDFEVIKGLCKKCDQYAIDVLKKMPKWIPAKVNGIPVKTRMILPVKFF